MKFKDAFWYVFLFLGSVVAVCGSGAFAIELFINGKYLIGILITIVDIVIISAFFASLVSNNDDDDKK